MAAEIPESHHDLVSDERPIVAVLATIMKDGSPQATPVWFDMDGDTVRINTARGRVKDHNMMARPRVALTIVDPDNPYRYMALRGDIVGDTEQGARDHINHLNLKYKGSTDYPVIPGEQRVIFRLVPRAVTARG